MYPGTATAQEQLLSLQQLIDGLSRSAPASSSPPSASHPAHSQGPFSPRFSEMKASLPQLQQIHLRAPATAHEAVAMYSSMLASANGSATGALSPTSLLGSLQPTSPATNTTNSASMLSALPSSASVLDALFGGAVDQVKAEPSKVNTQQQQQQQQQRQQQQQQRQRRPSKFEESVADAEDDADDDNSSNMFHSGDVRTNARLARNRTTARLRRERKKQEAEALTKYVAALRLRLKALEAALAQLPSPEARAGAEEAVRGFGPAPLACLFCAVTFEQQPALNEHLRLNHAAEVRAREQFLLESKSFGLPDLLPGNEDGDDDDGGGLAGLSPSLGAVLSSASTLAEQQQQQQQQQQLGSGSDDGGGGSQGSSGEQGMKLARLSSDERKKRRLERNAASARLCRQRKKLYIENLRSQLPALRHRVRALEAALPELAVATAQAATPLPRVGPELADGTPAGTAAAAASKKQQQQQQQQQYDDESMPSLSRQSSAPCVLSTGTRKRRGAGGDGDGASSSVDGGSSSSGGAGLQHEPPARPGTRDRKRSKSICAADALATAMAAEAASFKSSKIPPLSGWGKPAGGVPARRHSLAIPALASRLLSLPAQQQQHQQEAPHMSPAEGSTASPGFKAPPVPTRSFSLTSDPDLISAALGLHKMGGAN